MFPAKRFKDPKLNNAGEEAQNGEPNSTVGNTRYQAKEIQVQGLLEITRSQTWARIYQMTVSIGS